MSARAFNWACSQTPKTTSQKLVLLVLADRADEDGFCWPGTDWIARKCAPMPRETARRILRELADQGLLIKERRKRRNDGTLGTWEMRLQVVDGVWNGDQWAPVTAGSPGHERTVDHRSPVTEPPVTHARAYSRTEPRNKKNPDGFFNVVDHWLTCAPPLMPHKRETLVKNGKLKTAVRSALGEYSLDDVLSAISNYAMVLGSDAHYFEHRWTLRLFLVQRNALPMFVPEADPLTNFRTRPKANGRDRGLTFDEILNGGSNEQSTEPRPALPAGL